MAIQKVSVPKGTRDFSPVEMVKRNYIFNTIRDIFKKYGYQPIETPAIENLSTLIGKYGDEGDKLLFRILNSGDFVNKVPEKFWDCNYKRKEFETSQQLSPYIAEKGLRYDLTVPFARFVVQNQGKIQLPFKRYQVQPVWRADRPQKGRYREFYQCDADVAGSNSLLNETELIQIIDDVFSELNINVTIKLNNRKILSGIAEVVGAVENISDITVAIDKLDKIGKEGVRKELEEKGIDKKKINQIIEIINTKGSNTERINKLEVFLTESETGKKGINEIKELLKYISVVNISNKIETDFALARGLNYYTGAIIEIKANDVDIGSICAGGRYDDLTGIFGLPDVSGVGISFGADRIYDVLEQANGFPKDISSSVDIMFVNFGDMESTYCLPIIKDLRIQGLNVILYPDPVKIKKQMSYANALNISFVAVVGENEMKEDTVTLKNMITGNQQTVNIKDLKKYLE